MTVKNAEFSGSDAADQSLHQKRVKTPMEMVMMMLARSTQANPETRERKRDFLGDFFHEKDR